MANTPWRRSSILLDVDAGVRHSESASVPSAPGAGFGMFWVRDDATTAPMYTDSAGTDFVLNASGGALTGSPGNVYENLQFYVDPADRNSFLAEGGVVATDLEGNGTAGTLSAAAVFDNGAWTFNGASGDDVRFTKGVTLDNLFAGGGTIITVVRPYSSGQGTLGRVIDTTESTATTGYYISAADELTGHVRIQFNRNWTTTAGTWATDNITTAFGVSDRPLRQGAWAVVAVSYDDTATPPVVYLDGTVLAVTETSTPSVDGGSDFGNDVYIGNRSSGLFTWDGQIGTTLMFDRILTADEVQQVTNAFYARRGIGIRGYDSPSGVDPISGQTINVVAGDGIQADGTSDGGDVVIQAGDQTSASGGTAGEVIIRSGDQTTGTSFGDRGSRVLIESGVSSNGSGVTLRVGLQDNVNETGDVLIHSGDNDGSGSIGAVLIRGGAPSGIQSTRLGGAMVVRGGDAGENGSTNNHGGTAIFRGGEGIGNIGTGGDTTVRAGDAANNAGGGNLILRSGSTGTWVAGNVSLIASSATGAFGSGGGVTITAGDTFGVGRNDAGGSITTATGSTQSNSADVKAGDFTITTGNASLAGAATNAGGGSFIFTGGTSAKTVTSSPGGEFIVTGGDGTASSTNSRGGAVSLTGGAVTGASAATAGGVTLTGGAATVGTGGTISLQPGAGPVVGSLILDYSTWPALDGTGGFVLSTDGAGVLSWIVAGGGASTQIAQAGVILEGTRFHVDFNNQSSFAPNQTTTWLDTIVGDSGTTSATTIVDGHLNFNGSTSRVTFSAATTVMATAFAGGGTVYGWIRPESDGGGNAGRIIDTGVLAGPDKNYTLYVLGESAGFVKIGFFHSFVTTDGNWSTTSVEVPINEWAFVTATFDSDSPGTPPVIYVNGVSVAVSGTNGAGAADTSTSTIVYVGDGPSLTESFDGDIEMVGVCSTSHSAAAVADTYNATKSRFTGGATWAAALLAGNTSGGTDAVMSIGDSLIGVDSSSTTVNSGDLVLRGGNKTAVTGGADPGNVTIDGGSSTSTSTSPGGNVTITSGNQIAASGGAFAGTLFLLGATPTNSGGEGGPITIASGDGTTGGSAGGGDILITTGTASGASTGGGDFTVLCGSSAATGAGAAAAIVLTAGANPATGGGHPAGDVTVTAGAGGDITGDVFIRSGPNTNTAVPGTNNFIGDITIETGTVTGGSEDFFAGNIILNVQGDTSGGVDGVVGGDISLTAGNSGLTNAGDGGMVNITAGNTFGGNGRQAGHVTLTCGIENNGNSFSIGGSVFMVPGTSVSGSPGQVFIQGTGSMAMLERATAAGMGFYVPAAGYGRWWVRSDSPNVPMFTDDGGTDFVLTDNLYTADGTLSGARSVAFGSNAMTFSGAGEFIVNNTSKFLQDTPAVGEVATATGVDGSWTWQAAAGGTVELGLAVQATGTTNPALMDASFAWQITDTQALTFEASDTTDIMVISAAAGGDSVTFMAGAGAIAVTDGTIAATGGSLIVESSDAGSNILLRTTAGSGAGAGDLLFLTGAGTGAGAGGDFAVALGNGGATGNGGDFTGAAGNGGATSGAGGNVSFVAGQAGNAAGTAGTALLRAGHGGVAAVAGGLVTVQGGDGNTTGGGGSVRVQSGLAGVSGAGGAVQVQASSGGATTGAGGSVVVNAGGAPSPTAANAGNLTFTAGSATNGGGSGDGGTVSLQPGVAAGSGTDGSLILDYSIYPAAEGAVDQVLTTDGAGVLSWATTAVAPSQWQSVTTQTTGTGAGSETFTLATPIAAIAVDEQQWVEVRIIGEDTTNPDTHTFFTQEFKAYYRGAGAATLWSNEVVGAENNRGFGTEITSVNLTLSGNAVIVELTYASSTRTIDWCVQYLTKTSVADAGAGASTTNGNVLTFDNRGAPISTGSIAAGGFANFETNVGASYGEMKFLRVSATADASTDVNIVGYRDSGRTDEIYRSDTKDPTIQFTDRTPATLVGDDGTALESNTVYWKIENDAGAGAVTLDFELVFWSDGTVAGGGVSTVDKRGANKTVTASAGIGGTATGSINLGIDTGSTVYLRVVANGNTIDSTIEFWRDVGKTDLLYQSLNRDAFTTPFVDGTSWALCSESDLESQSIYYTITNNGLNASTYDISLLAHGE